MPVTWIENHRNIYVASSGCGSVGREDYFRQEVNSSNLVIGKIL